MKKNIKYILAPLGVTTGITTILLISTFTAKLTGIETLTKIMPFIPNFFIFLFGIILLLIWLPVFFLGIYFLTPQGAIGQSKTLRRNGIYKYVRNPMYSGISFSICGIGFLFNKTGVVMAGILWFILCFIQSKREEKELFNHFGNLYLEYKKITPMFLPNFRLLMKRLF